MDIGTFSVTHYDEYNQTGDLNLFERVIDSLMIEKYSNDREISEYIESLSREDKRIAILSLLDGDNGMWVKLKSLIKGNELTKMDHIKDVILMLRDFVKVGEVEKKKFGEVMSPLELVKEMISTLPEEVWSNPNLKWLDPANGTGPYPLMVIYKLMKGLEDWEPDPNKRYKHIVENMIYTCELQARNVFLWLCAVDPHDEYKTNTYWGSFLEDGFDKHMKEVWGVEKFDIVLGNPPYQEMDGGAKASAKPIYNLFTLKSINLSNKVLFVTPSRWFAGGKGLDTYRKFMMESNRIRLIKHFDDASEIFGKSVEIKGGVSYFLWDNIYNGDCNFNGVKIDIKLKDIILTNPMFMKISDKFENMISISSICDNSNIFGIDYRSGNGNKIVDSKENSDYVKVYTSKSKGFVKYINKNFIKKGNDHWRVATPRAATKGGEGFGNIFIVPKGEYTSDTYITFRVDNYLEAKSLASYLNTKVANFLLGLRKISQDIKPDTCRWIPIVPFDREWTDSQLYEYFNLTEEEINLIESSVK